MRCLQDFIKEEGTHILLKEFIAYKTLKLAHKKRRCFQRLLFFILSPVFGAYFNTIEDLPIMALSAYNNTV